MGQHIVKLEGKYLLWSTIVDAPITYGMTLTELKAYVKEESGNEGLRELPKRLERVEQKGTSALNRDSADDTIWLNRAGKDETRLTRAEFVATYVTDPKAHPPKGAPAWGEGDDAWTFERFMGEK